MSANEAPPPNALLSQGFKQTTACSLTFLLAFHLLPKLPHFLHLRRSRLLRAGLEHRAVDAVVILTPRLIHGAALAMMMTRRAVVFVLLPIVFEEVAEGLLRVVQRVLREGSHPSQRASAVMMMMMMVVAMDVPAVSSVIGRTVDPRAHPAGRAEQVLRRCYPQVVLHDRWPRARRCGR